MYGRLISTGSFELFRIVQAIWAVVLAILAIVVMFVGGGPLSGLYLAAVCLYLLASWGVFLNCRWAWTVSLAFLLGYWILGAAGRIGGIPFPVSLVVLAASHRLSHASPVGLGFVWFHALFFIIPPACLTLLGMVSIRGIIRALRGQPMPASDL